MTQEKRVRENWKRKGKGISLPGEQEHRLYSRRESSGSEGRNKEPGIWSGGNLGKSGERRQAGSRGQPSQTFVGHMQFCLHPQSNEEKLEGFKKVNSQIRFELWRDHSN